MTKRERYLECVLEMVMKINHETPASAKMSYDGVGEQVRVRVYANGWKPGIKPDFDMALLADERGEERLGTMLDRLYDWYKLIRDSYVNMELR